MSKDRPFKNFKTPQERPFKTYNPGNTSMLFQDPTEQQPLRLGLINGIMQQQQQQQQQSFVQQQQPSASVQQVYGDPEDYLHLNPQRGQNPMMNIDPSLSSYYEDLGLDDPDNPLIRPDLLVTSESILQREQDLNIGQSPNSMTITPNFIVPNRHNPRGIAGLPPSMASPPVSMQDSLSMLFDQSQAAATHFAASLQPPQQQQLLPKSNSDRNCSEGQGVNGSHFLNSMAAGGQGSMGGLIDGSNSHGSNGRSVTVSMGDILPSSSGLDMDPFPVKREADEGQALGAETPSPSSIQSPTQSDLIEPHWDSPKQNLKRSVSDSSTCSVSHCETSKEDGNSDSPNDNDDKGDSKDPAYLEKRRKNNESAKRSREARRNKEELVALRVITLEEENMKLRAEISLLDKELDELRARLFT